MTKAELLTGSPIPTPGPAVTNGKRYMTRAEAAKYITDNWFPHSPKTLAKLAVIGGGPVFRKAGRVPIICPPIATIMRGAKSVSRFARPRNWRRLALRSYMLTTLKIKLLRAQRTTSCPTTGAINERHERSAALVPCARHSRA